MRFHANARALLTALVAVTTLAPAAFAQRADSVHRWSIFGGTPGRYSGSTNVIDNNQFGLSGDFRVPAFPLQLRGTLALTRFQLAGGYAQLQTGALSLDAMARPLPRVFGTQLYLLGGLGVESRAPYTDVVRGYTDPTIPVAGLNTVFRVRRDTWAFAEGGIGLDFGRAFIELKHLVPVASDGIGRSPLSIGFHF